MVQEHPRLQVRRDRGQQLEGSEILCLVVNHELVDVGAKQVPYQAVNKVVVFV